MSGEVLRFTKEFASIGACITCGVEMLMTTDMEIQRRRDHGRFFCLNGHSQYWPQKSDIDKLRSELAEKERQIEFERNRAASNFAARQKAERELKKSKRRASGGVCQCCNRSFVALARHMKTKHPDFVEENKATE